jgi:hypothetical protein
MKNGKKFPPFFNFVAARDRHSHSRSSFVHLLRAFHLKQVPSSTGIFALLTQFAVFTVLVATLIPGRIICFALSI